MINLKITDVRVNPGDSAFLIDDGKTSIMYDSGFAFTGYAVADKIKEQLGDRKLDYIFLTHSHYDHALGSVYALEYWPEAKVVAGEYASKIFAKPTAKSVMRDLDRKHAEECGVYEYEDLINNLKVDIPVNDGDVINVGDMKFTAVSLPGHTKCSMGFYLEENKLLLGCETIGVSDGGEMVFPSYLVGYEMTLDSIDKVQKLDIENILIPHIGLFDKDQTKTYLKNSRICTVMTAEKVLGILKNGGGYEEAEKYIIDTFYRGHMKEIYPVNALKLNTGIMVKLIEKELLLEFE